MVQRRDRDMDEMTFESCLKFVQMCHLVLSVDSIVYELYSTTIRWSSPWELQTLSQSLQLLKGKGMVALAWQERDNQTAGRSAHQSYPENPK